MRWKSRSSAAPVEVLTEGCSLFNWAVRGVVYTPWWVESVRPATNPKPLLFLNALDSPLRHQLGGASQWGWFSRVEIGSSCCLDFWLDPFPIPRSGREFPNSSWLFSLRRVLGVGVSWVVCGGEGVCFLLLSADAAAFCCRCCCLLLMLLLFAAVACRFFSCWL